MGKPIIYITIAAVLCHSLVAFQPNPDCTNNAAGCFSDCSGDCTFEVAWITSETATDVDFVMKSSVPSLSTSGNWIAFGLNSDKKMGGATVFECITDGTNFFIRRSRNTNTYGNVDVVDNDSWITAVTGSYSNGVITCSFTALKSNNAAVNFGSEWYILFAKGTVTSQNVKNRHTFRIFTDSAAKLSAKGVLATAGQNKMLKLHGSMMITAWILCASIGIVVARYYKPVWLEKKLIGEKVWFTIHRFVMVCAVLFCIAGFVVIFVEKGKFQQIGSDSDLEKAHPFLGVIIMGLAVIQPVMALCRPHPGDKNRLIFNWAHWAVGVVAHILAALNILIGTMLDAMEMPEWVIYIVVAYAAYQLLMEVFLEIYDSFERNKSSSSKYETDSATKGNEPKYSFKKAVLGLHVFIIVGFTATLIILVAMDLSDQK